MDKRLASVAILVKKGANTHALNNILSNYADFILGRQGINVVHRKISIISLIVEADTDTISALSGKIGRLKNLTVKTAMLKVESNDEVNE